MSQGSVPDLVKQQCNGEKAGLSARFFGAWLTSEAPATTSQHLASAIGSIRCQGKRDQQQHSEARHGAS